MAPNPRASRCVKVYADLLRKTIRLLTSPNRFFAVDILSLNLLRPFFVINIKMNKYPQR
jgi:hypothetical protein